MGSKAYLQATEKYLTVPQVKKLQHYLAAKDLAQNKLYGSRLPRERKGPYTLSYLGSIFKFERNEAGIVDRIEPIETGTYEKIEFVATKDNRFACIVPDPEVGDLLYISENNRLVKKTIKNMHTIARLALVGNTGVVLANDSLLIHASVDNESTWDIYDGAVLSKRLSKFSGVRAISGKNGYYIFSTNSDSTLLYRDYKHAGGFKKIAPPYPGYEFGGLDETVNGLYTSPNYTEWVKGKYYFLPAGTDQWVECMCPTKGCRTLEVDDNKIDLKCFGITWRSTDMGKTWKELPHHDQKMMDISHYNKKGPPDRTQVAPSISGELFKC